MMLNFFGNISSPPQSLHFWSSSKSSFLKRLWHFLHSESSSAKPADKCPEASHIFGDINMAESMPTMFS